MLIGMIPLSYCAACAGKPCDGNAWNAAFSAATSNALGTYAGNASNYDGQTGYAGDYYSTDSSTGVNGALSF